MGKEYADKEYNRFEDWRCKACGYKHELRSQFPGMEYIPDIEKVELTCRRCGFKEEFAMWKHYQD